MPRQNREEFDADLAAAKLEGFGECRALVERLADAGLSLKVAKYALGEAEADLDALRAEAFSKAKASRAPTEKPKRKRTPRPAAPPPAPADPAELPGELAAQPAAEPVAEPLPDPGEEPVAESPATELPPQSIPHDPSKDDDIPF